MIRRVENPPNPYESIDRHWLEQPPKATVEVYHEEARSILSQNDSPDLPFRWSVNPYRGCQHGCAYCYARPYHEYLGHGAGTDFESKLIVKVNAADLLAEEFARRRWKYEPIVFSGVTDCYQPLEAVYQVTRRCLEACLRHRNPVGIVTRSYLIGRDASLLAELNAVAAATVFMSLPFADDARARLIEPNAPPPSRRLEAMRKLHGSGIPVGVFVAPIIPGLNESEIPEILRQSADAGATMASFTALRLPRPVDAVFLSRLRETMPHRVKRVENRIRDIRDGRLNDTRFGHRMRGQGAYWDSVRRLFDVSAQRLGLSTGCFANPARPNENTLPPQFTFGFASE